MPDNLSELTEHPEPFMVLPSKTHTHTVVLLHGLSTNGVSFGTDFMENALDAEGSTLSQAFPHVRFVFPSGAPRRCTAFGGKLMHVWFDIISIADRTVGEDKQIEGLAESTTYLWGLIREEIAVLELVGRSREDLVLGGFSQGCATSIWALLNMGLELGGYVGMSGWLPFRRQIDSAMNVDTDQRARRLAALEYIKNTVPIPYLSHCPAPERLKGLVTHVFLGHGSKDVKVRTAWGEDMRDTLKSLDVDVVWKEYEALEHWYKVPDEVEDISGFLRNYRRRNLITHGSQSYYLGGVLMAKAVAQSTSTTITNSTTLTVTKNKWQQQGTNAFVTFTPTYSCWGVTVTHGTEDQGEFNFCQPALMSDGIGVEGDYTVVYTN